MQAKRLIKSSVASCLTQLYTVSHRDTDLAQTENETIFLRSSTESNEIAYHEILTRHEWTLMLCLTKVNKNNTSDMSRKSGLQPVFINQQKLKLGQSNLSKHEFYECIAVPNISKVIFLPSLPSLYG